MANVSNQGDSAVEASLDGGQPTLIAQTDTVAVGTSTAGTGLLKITQSGTTKYHGYVPLMTQFPLVFDGDHLRLNGVVLPTSRCRSLIPLNDTAKIFIGAVAILLVIGMVYWFQTPHQRKSERPK